MTSREAIRAHVLRAIALNREPGFHFAGNLLDIGFHPTARGMTASFETGPHLSDADGQANIGAIAMLADVALASSIRAELEPQTRLATVAMSLEFTGAPALQAMHAEGEFSGFFQGTASRQGMSRVVVRSGATEVCHGHGSFMALEAPAGVALHPMPTTRRPEPAPLDEKSLTRPEKELLRLADSVLGDPAAESAFLQRLWGFAPHRTKDGARAKMKNGGHVANRVGHVQGGILLGLAATTACAAAPPRWSFTSINAAFVSPGIGAVLRVRSKVVHHGLLTAVVRTEIMGPGRRRVLEATTTHSR
jgi:acyl-coenzyme A thioesterase PaaI-like protein